MKPKKYLNSKCLEKYKYDSLSMKKDFCIPFGISHTVWIYNFELNVDPYFVIDIRDERLNKLAYRKIYINNDIQATHLFLQLAKTIEKAKAYSLKIKDSS